MLRFAIPAVLLSAGLLSAQTMVSPAHFAGAEGNSSDRGPFGTTSSPYRHLQVHDDMQGKGMKISGMALRRDGKRSNSYAKYVVVCDVLLSTAKTKAASPSKTFDSNHGPDKKTVAGFAQINFPATEEGNLPAPFVYKVPFASPFTFGGQGGLCWEVKVSVRQNNFSVYFDAVSGTSSNPRLEVWRTGQGCRATGQGEAYMLGSSSMNWPNNSATMIFNGYRGPKNSTGLVLLGLRDDTFSGIPLPFELPGTAQSPSKACRLYVSPFFFLPAFFDGSGRFTLQFGFPVDPTFNGATVFSQYVGLDAKANNWGAIFSDKLQHNFVAPWKSAVLGQVYGATAGTTGTVRANRGLVVQFN